MGCSAWSLEESDTTEKLPFHFSLSCIGEGNGNPLQCSCLENPRDGGAWWAAIYWVAQSWTRLNRLSSSSMQNKNMEPQQGMGKTVSPSHNPASQLAVNERPPPTTTKKLQPPRLQDAGKKPPLNCSPYGPRGCQLVQGWPPCPIPRCHNPGHTLHLDFLHSSTPNLQTEEGRVIRQASPADPPNHHTRWRAAAVTRQGWEDGAGGQEEAPGAGSCLLSI